MRRRDLIKVFASSAVAWPLGARAQQPAMKTIGFLRSASLADTNQLVVAFLKGLKESGYTEGQNVAIEFRSAEDNPDRLRVLVTEFIRRPVDLIVGNVVAAVAAKAATTTVPIVFAAGGDPVALGLVASLNRPGGNVTGVSFFGQLLGAKRLELLRLLVPKLTTIAILVNPISPETAAERKDLQAAALAIGQPIIILDVSSIGDIEPAFATLVQRGAGALLVGAGAFFLSHRQQLVALAVRHKIPAIYALRDSTVSGGLMSYGASITSAYHQVGIYAGRILKGEKPANLPVVQSTKFELVLNLKTAKSLGLSIPDKLLALADEVIE